MCAHPAIVGVLLLLFMVFVACTVTPTLDSDSMHVVQRQGEEVYREYFLASASGVMLLAKASTTDVYTLRA